MESYTRRDGNSMKRDAECRARQMQQKVPYRRQNTSRTSDRASASFRAEPKRYDNDKTQSKASSDSAKSSNADHPGLPFNLSGTGLDRMLEHMDTDKMLIIALLAMIYKDGSNKRLMMALAYLLT